MQNRNQTKYKLKKDLVDHLGGKCINCGYDKCLAALTFHHVFPERKEHAMAHLISKPSRAKAFAEVEKCVLLCSNCHIELHQEEFQLNLYELFWCG